MACHRLRLRLRLSFSLVTRGHKKCKRFWREREGGDSFATTTTAAPPPHHPTATDIPSPHCQPFHTTTTPTDHHRTNAQRFAPTRRMNRRRKVHLLAGTPAPASTATSTQQTKSSADLAAPAQRGGGRGRFTKEQIRCQRIESSFKKAGEGVLAYCSFGRSRFFFNRLRLL